MDKHAFLQLLPIVVYLVATADLVLSEVFERRRFRSSGLLLAALGVVLHAISLFQSIDTPAGWDANFFNMFSLAGLLIIATLVATSLAWPRASEACIVAAPGAALAAALHWLVPVEPLMLGALSETARLHIVSSLLAYSLLSIAAINAIMLSAQDYALRHPRMINRLDFLPPLAVIESIMFRLILTGWLLLTLSLLSGLAFVDNLLAQHLVHKTGLSVLSWLLFGGLLLGRWRLGWRGRRAVRWTLIAMLVLALSYFGSKLVLELFLDRSWQTAAEAQSFVRFIR